MRSTEIAEGASKRNTFNATKHSIRTGREHSDIQQAAKLVMRSDISHFATTLPKSAPRSLLQDRAPCIWSFAPAPDLPRVEAQPLV